jgi:hypothetical protein
MTLQAALRRYELWSPILCDTYGLTGSHHWEDKQSLNDRRKWKLAEINGVRCLTMMNGIMERLSNRKWRALLGRFLFGCQEPM